MSEQGFFLPWGFWRILEEVSQFSVSEKNGQIIFKDAGKVHTDRVIDSDKWNPVFIYFLMNLQNGFPVFCGILINCRLHCVGFLATITLMKSSFFALFFKSLIRKTDSSDLSG